ncbi:MAG: DUF3570 domain-containing protein [Acidobacteriota bacterium]
MAATDEIWTRWKRCLLATGVGLLAPAAARAQSTLDIRTLFYSEADGRTSVVTPEVYLLEDFEDKGKFGVLLSYDSISGASPTGEAPTSDTTTSASGRTTVTGSVPTATYEDTRKAISTSYSRRFGRNLPEVQIDYSRENDYLSRGFSLVDGLDLLGGSATLRLGIGASRDRIEPTNQSVSYDKKSEALTVGWTQVLGPRDLLDLSLGATRLSGFLSDPYKKVTVGSDAMAEVRPTERRRYSLVVKYGHHFLMRSALKGFFRVYTDDWGIRSGTLDLTYEQHMGQRWIVSPHLRFYRQTGADFFGYEFDQPEPFMSGDYRLSSFDSWLAGCGARVALTDKLALTLDGGYQLQRGTDRFSLPASTGGGGDEGGDEEGGDEGRRGGGGSFSTADLTTVTLAVGISVRF